jgi:Domain of unknown function (DUF1877)
MSMILCVRRATDSDLSELRTNPSKTSEFLFDEAAQQAGDYVDFDKAWQALHFTLTGAPYNTNSPLGILLNKGTEIGEDTGYGRPWVVPNENVRRFRAEFSLLSDHDLKTRYDPAAMEAADVYLSDMFVEEGDDAWSYITQSLPQFRTLIDRAIQTDASLVIALT